MEPLHKARQKVRRPSDFLGAVCFVVLIATVVYAALTSA